MCPAQNARKHGFRAVTEILTLEQEAEIEAIRINFARDFRPNTNLKSLAKAFWTLGRLDAEEEAAYALPEPEKSIGKLSTLARYRAHHERLFYRFFANLANLAIKNCTN